MSVEQRMPIRQVKIVKLLLWLVLIVMVEVRGDNVVGEVLVTDVRARHHVRAGRHVRAVREKISLRRNNQRPTTRMKRFEK
jgi:hypothetical protein